MSGERAFLCLADGATFEGTAWGAPGIATGEVVFTTGMTGYEEVLTDPSYAGQIVTMTAAEIGNTGVNLEDGESADAAPHVAGFLIRDLSPVASSWRATATLHDYLARHGIVALAGIDTRRLTRYLRDRGAQNGAIGAASPDELVRRAREAPAMEGLDLVGRVTPKEPYAYPASGATGATAATGATGTSSTQPSSTDDLILPVPGAMIGAAPAGGPSADRHVVAIDLGMKKNILRCLASSGCRVTVVPARTTAAEILSLAPDGVFVSNGPGDPAALSYAVQTVRDLLGKRPLFGICLGHQLLALAAGGRTYKLKFGHRGVNQPVKDLLTGRVEITTQNHGFAVDLASLGSGLNAQTTHVHLNDGTSEGLMLPDLDAFSVQYHPEAAAGPHDSMGLFGRFVQRIDAARGRAKH